MASRYWVASTSGNWNDTANWSTTSGGASGASVPGASDDVIFDGSGVGDCRLDVATNVVNFTITSGYTGTIDAATDNLDHTVTGVLTATGATGCTFNAGSGEWFINNDINFYEVTFNHNNGTINYTGAHTVRPPVSLYNLTISNSVTNDKGGVRVNGTLRITSSGTLNDNNDMTGGDNMSVVIESGGVLADTFSMLGGGTVTNSGDVTGKLVVKFEQTTLTATVSAGSYSGTLQYHHRDSSGPSTCTLGAGTFNIGTLSLLNERSTDSNLDLSTNNPSLTIAGNVTWSETSDGIINWNAGTGTVTLDNTAEQAINFNGQSIEDIIINKSAGSVILTNNLTTDSLTLTDGTLDISGYNFTTTGNFTQGVATIVQDSNGSGLITVGGDFRINGNNDSPTIWNDADLNVSGSALATNVTVSGSDASSGNIINATRNSIDNGENLNWAFRNAFANIYKKLTVKSNSKLTIKDN